MHYFNHSIGCCLIFFISMMACAKDKQATVFTDNVMEVIGVRGIEEPWLNTPFMVDLIRGKNITERKPGSVEDVLRTLPGVNIHHGGDVGTAFIWVRGTGSLTHTSLDDNSVDISIDGVSNGLLGLGRNLLDVEQIALSKGPQDTLYGQAAQAGVVTVKTRNPQPDFQAKVGAGMGSDRQRNVDTMLNIPLNENWSFRVAAMAEQRDDYIKKRENGSPLNQKTREAIQAKLRWNDEKNNDIILQLYHDSSKNFMGMVLKLDQDPKVTTGGLPHHTWRENHGVTLNIRHDLDFARFQSNSGWLHHEGKVTKPNSPLDHLSATWNVLNIPVSLRPALDAWFTEDRNNRLVQSDNINQFSQEFRLISPPHSKVNWVTGLYFSSRDRDFILDSMRDLYTLNGTVLAGNDVFNALLRRNYNIDTQALFGEITYPLPYRFSLTGGARITNEKLRYHVSWRPNANNPVVVTGAKYNQQTWYDTYLTGRIALRFDLTPRWRLYALQSKGHKSAGFADYSTNIAWGEKDKPYRASRVLATEIGSKFTSEDNRLQLGLAVYQNRVSDDHITVYKYSGIVPFFDTLSVDSRATGIEVNNQWQFNHLTLRGAFAWTDARVTAVPAVSQAMTNKGNRMPQVPYISGSLEANYVNLLPSGLLSNADWFTNISLRYVGDRFAEPNNVQRLDRYILLDVSLGIDSHFGQMKLYGKNLTGEKWAYFGVAGNQGLLAPGRTWGVSYYYEF